MKLKLPEIYKAYMYSYPHKNAYGPLSGINLFEYLALCDLKQAEIYFHIPFCADKCGYCNLFSVSGQNEEYFDHYLDAMAKQILQYGLKEFTPRRLTIGGGTPLILSEAQLERLMRLLPDTEKTIINIETSPNETTKSKLEVLRLFSVKRISVGVQSFLDNELKNLKRQHSSRSIYNCLALVKEHDFPITNLDLIYGIPEQTMASFQISLAEGLKFTPEEFFIYPLYIRKGTGIANTPANDHMYKMYHLACDILLAAGYSQISMRRFVKNSPDSQAGCGFETMLAIGCGGRSYLGNLHFCRPYSISRSESEKIISDYINDQDKTLVTHGYLLNQEEQKRRFVIKNLLHIHGIFPAEYREIFKTDLYSDFPVLREWVEQGYLQIQAAESSFQIKLTPLGLSLSDYIGPELISAEVRQRMERSMERQN